jgi:hypothetical protein
LKLIHSLIDCLLLRHVGVEVIPNSLKALAEPCVPRARIVAAVPKSIC